MLCCCQHLKKGGKKNFFLKDPSCLVLTWFHAIPSVPETDSIKSSCQSHLVITCRVFLSDSRELISPRDSLPVSCGVQKYGHAKSLSRQPWREVTPQDRWKPSAARENVITVPALYIFINTARIAIRGNAPSLTGTLKRSVL